MSKSSREIIALLVLDGWFEAGQTGSHRHFKHPANRER
jgi:predicted RNA binding protein YcfA (HicA-like mRNA interferase family)